MVMVNSQIFTKNQRYFLACYLSLSLDSRIYTQYFKRNEKIPLYLNIQTHQEAGYSTDHIFLSELKIDMIQIDWERSVTCWAPQISLISRLVLNTNSLKHFN